MGRFVHTLARQVGRGIDTMERLIAQRGDVGQGPYATTPSVAGSSISAAALAAALPLLGGPGGQQAPPAGVLGAEPPPLEVPHSEALWDDTQAGLFAVRSTLPEVEDRRSFHPDFARPSRTVRGNRTRLKFSRAQLGLVTLPTGIEFAAKDQVIMCIRRKARRGVLLALGQGGGYHRPPRRSPTSDIWC